MTICASVKVRDGLVLATDSMTQIQSPGVGVIKTYANARKLFPLEGLPIGVMSYGVGNIGNRSIQSFVREFNSGLKLKGVKTVTQALYDFIAAAYEAEFASMDAADRPALGFFVAGYSGKNVFAEEWEFRLPADPRHREVRPESVFGASWRGIDLPFTRLYFGYDPRALEALQAAGLTDAQIEAAFRPYQAQVVYDGMPVQDAINFAVFIAETTIGMATFELGPPACGLPLQVATILPGAEFVWVSNPQLSIS